MTPLVLEATLKGSLVLLVALAVLPLLRRRSAALRHYVLAAAVACAVAAPVAQRLVPAWPAWPAWPQPLVQPAIAPHTDGSQASTAERPAAAVRRGDPAPVEQTGSTLPAAGLMALWWMWLTGAALGVAVLLVGLVRLARLSSRSTPMGDARWAERTAEICRDYGIGRPVTLLQGHDPSLLVTWGVRRPRIILPRAACAWSDERVRLVLLHELAHVRRADWIVQLAAELLRAACWFNPLIWISCRRLRHESEQACDDAVLNRGVDGPDYATHLVGIARELQTRAMWLPAPAIARTSSLERRVTAMLDSTRNRRPPSRRVRNAALLALAVVTIPIAGLAAQRALATVTGSIVDPSNSVLPGVILVLTNPQSQAKYEVRSDSAGRYEFVGVPPADYVFEAKLPGFASLRGTLALTGQNVQQDLKLEVGSLAETVTVRRSSGAPSEPPATPRAKGPRPECGQARTAAPIAGQIRVGGNIRAPRKLLHVMPRYPAGGAAGAVVLQARISTDGSVDDVEVVSSPDASLTDAAIEAVRQWQFDETLLNCVPVAVKMKVTVNFE